MRLPLDLSVSPNDEVAAVARNEVMAEGVVGVADEVGAGAVDAGSDSGVAGAGADADDDGGGCGGDSGCAIYCELSSSSSARVPVERRPYSFLNLNTSLADNFCTDCVLFYQWDRCCHLIYTYIVCCALLTA